MKTFKKFLFLLTFYERKRAALLLLMILIMALLDMIGVASILPFMAVLTNPDIVKTNIILTEMFRLSKIFGVENTDQFLFALGFLFFILLVTSLLFKALTTYTQVRFVQMRQYSIGKRLIKLYLNQPYSWFLNRHSAELGKTILSEVGQVVGNGLKPLIDLIARTMIALTIIILLVITDPKLIMIVGFLFGGAYGLIFYYTRSYLKKIGNERLKNNELRFTAVNEAFGAAKEVKVGGLEKAYIKQFSQAAQNFAKTVASSQVIAQLPRFILEAIAFGGIILVILFMMTKKGSFNNALPILSLYVFAGYRLMPALQGIYNSFIQLTFIGPSLDKLYEDIKSLKPFNFNEDKNIILPNKQISLKDVNYSYPNVSRTALKNISIKIPVKTTVGLVGETGSGKTTLVDIILGLLEAQQGTLEVDEKIITTQNVRSWQRSIGYVPQSIYLVDDSIAVNIALGSDYNDIDLKAVEKASKIANLHDFIINELPNKYNTIIGERGVRLSGGQRQRIGIARAIYHNPQVLVLDEATSSLDNQTEKAVMDAVNNLTKDITIILIAHRLSTVKKCDTIFLLEKGEIKNKGTFEELIKNNESFRITANYQ